MRFVHAADLHLDSPLRGLSRYEGAPTDRIRGATRDAMRNLVDLCLEEAADFLLVAGDLYDGDWPDYSTGLFFSAQMSRLREADIPVYLVRGNHDAQNRMTRGLDLPDNVRELSWRKPETVLDERLGLAVHGQGFARREVRDDLAAAYPDPVAGMFNVGLLHTCLDGREGHDPYAPCKVETLIDKGYDYWALGHVHAREVVHREPWIVFPGNLQGRHARETGDKGATLVTVEDGRVAAAEHRALDVVRWQVIELDASGAESGDDVVDLTRGALEAAVAEADGRLVAARIVVAGECSAHRTLQGEPERWESQLRAAATDLGAGAAWIEKVRFATTAPVDLAELRARDDALGQLARSLAELRADDAALASLAAELADLDKKLPREAKEGPDGIRLDDPALLGELVDEVERMLLPRLLSKEDAS